MVNEDDYFVNAIGEFRANNVTGNLMIDRYTGVKTLVKNRSTITQEQLRKVLKCSMAGAKRLIDRLIADSR